jgi:hypothetical protein
MKAETVSPRSGTYVPDSYCTHSAFLGEHLSRNLEFFERTGCHLCIAASDHVERLARRIQARIIRIDIETDDRLVADYGLRIPVVKLDGVEIAEGVINYRALLRAAKDVSEHGYPRST